MGYALKTNTTLTDLNLGCANGRKERIVVEQDFVVEIFINSERN